MPRVTYEDVRSHSPDIMLPPDLEFDELYSVEAETGRAIAAESTVAFVAICRNAMPWLPLTLGILEQTAEMFGDWSAYIYENDSIDGTKEALAKWSDGSRRVVSLSDNGRPHLNFTTESVRTNALAEYRTECQKFVCGLASQPDYVIVFDTDPWGGWSVDGVANSLSWMKKDRDLFSLASYSWCEWGPPIASFPSPCHYDAFAARLNHWRQRDQNWFHLWHPPVGSPPVPFRSAFGQLAVYNGEDFCGGSYSGEDCEHVTFHRSIHSRTGKKMALNPSMRCVSFWIAREDTNPEETRCEQPIDA